MGDAACSINTPPPYTHTQPSMVYLKAQGEHDIGSLTLIPACTRACVLQLLPEDVRFRFLHVYVAFNRISAQIAVQYQPYKALIRVPVSDSGPGQASDVLILPRYLMIAKTTLA